MLKSYFLIAFRNLVKSPMHSVIKVSGLAVGVAGCLIIFLIARYELSFDNFQPEKDRIFRIYSQFGGLWTGYNRGVPLALPQKVRDEFTGVEAVTSFETYSATVTVEDQSGSKKKLERQENIILTDPDYFEVLNMYEWVVGSPKVLEAPFALVLTVGKAKTYFGTTDLDRIVGKKVVYIDSLELTVVGLVKDLTERTDFYFTDFISYSTIKQSWLKGNFPDLNNWGSTNGSSQCFVKLAKGVDRQKVEDQMPVLQKARDAQNKDSDTKVNYHLQALSDIHFNKDVRIFDNSRNSVSLPTLKTLMIIALLLLIVASINFINLETAQAVRRAKEVGLRKVMGGTRSSLIKYFLTESFLFTAIAVLLSLPLCYLTVLLLSEFMPEGLKFTLADSSLWIFIAVTILLVAGLSGVYPAFVLSSYQPAVALKNQMVNGRQSRSAYLRKFLTVFQFSFSQVLIVGTLIVGWQIKFMLDKDLGFTQDAIVAFNTPWWEKANKRSILRNELDKLTGIVAISQHDRPPASSGWSTTSVKFNNGKEELTHNVHIKRADTSYVRLFDLELVAGRNVQPSDSIRELLINETYCRQLGIAPIDMVGQSLKTSGGDRGVPVVGILKDFHFQSLHYAIEPLLFSYAGNNSGFSVKLQSQGKQIENLDQTLNKLTAALNKVYPDEKIKITFFDESIENLYKEEKRMAKLTNTATGLAIFISCLGLFGLASYTAIQRTKEIGIRKVLGATVNNIVTLLSKEFLLLVLIAFVIAVPMAWLAAGKWLSEFAYRVEINLWVFLIAGILSILIAFLTVAFHALKAAIMDPVKSLRYE